MLTSVSHIALFVPDLQEAERFYKDLFEMELIGREIEMEDGLWYTLPFDKEWEDVKTADEGIEWLISHQRYPVREAGFATFHHGDTGTQHTLWVTDQPSEEGIIHRGQQWVSRIQVCGPELFPHLRMAVLGQQPAIVLGTPPHKAAITLIGNTVRAS